MAKLMEPFISLNTERAGDISVHGTCIFISPDIPAAILEDQAMRPESEL
jgi:hypothetical protein